MFDGVWVFMTGLRMRNDLVFRLFKVSCAILTLLFGVYLGTASDASADPLLDAMRAIRALPDSGPKDSFDFRGYLYEHPLAPPDTSSPRAALESYLLLVNEAESIWRKVRSEFQGSSSQGLTEEQERQVALVNTLLGKAARIFDLKGIPETTRKREGLEIVLQFQEILDRIYLPALEKAPGAPAGTFLNSKAIDKLPARWQIPGTDIVFEKTDTPGIGNQFLITKSSVEHIPADYELIKSFPAKRDKGDDLYAYYIYTPGNLIAPRWYDLIRSGPVWLGNQALSQAYWQWIALVLLTAVMFAVPIIFYRWKRWRAVPLSDIRRKLRAFQFPIIVILSVMAYRYLIEEQVNITGGIMSAVGTISTTIIWAATSWLTFLIVDFVSAWIIKNPSVPTTSLDSSLLRTGFRLIGVAVAVMVLGYGATRIGIPIYGVFAGLGVGGLAVALAAQPTLENLIGGFILYADRMVRVGEFCEFDGLSGTIETIGIRSTRIRALDRTIITVSNADLAKRKIVNYSCRDQFHFKHLITLRYETSETQLKKVIEEIQAFLEAHEMVAEEPLRVRFVGLGAFSLDVEVYAYILTPSRDTFLEYQEDMLIKIVEIVHECGTDFAFPSTTTYLAQDSGLPADSKAWIEENLSRQGNDATVAEGERQAG